MPYKWTATESNDPQLILWPFSSLPIKGFAAVIMTMFTLMTVPLYPLLGLGVFWGLLPFLLIVLAALWFALRKNYRDRSVVEILALADNEITLVRRDPDGRNREWSCNVYWARVHKHEKDGPVPHYVTLSGNGREVEVGAFLSEEERVELYHDLERQIGKWRAAANGVTQG